MMKTAEMVKEVAEKVEMTQGKVREVLDAYAEVVKENLMGAGEIPLPGIGKFKVKDKKATPAKEGRNPKDGSIIQIAAKPACKVPQFKVSPKIVEEMKVVVE